MTEASSIVGTVVGNRYTVSERLGAGGMAVVYRAADQVSSRDWALKVMTAALLGDVEAQRRFKGEHRVMAALDHPGIPKVQDLGLTSDGLPFFAMEIVEGASLEHEGPWTPDQVRALAAELMPILGHLHRRGLVHGDLKGENLMRNADGRLMLMDFGLAGPAGARPNGLEGTVSHLAPELIQRGKADLRSDLYAVGVIIYRLITGTLPFDGGTPAETLKLHVGAVPASPRKHVPDLSSELESLVMRLLAKRPQDRPQSANEVLRALGLPADEEDTLAIPLQGPFVGRLALMGELLAGVGEAANGHRPKPVALVGVPGVGKSRLLEELGAQSRLMDLKTATGGCPADPTPFGPWIDLSRDLLALARSIAPEQATALQQAIAPLTGGGAAGTGDPAQVLRVALTRLLETVAGGRGLVVMLDDWHRADPPSATLLTQVMQATERTPIAWIATSAAPVASAFDVKALGELTQAETAQLVASNVGATEMPSAVTDQIFESSRGNPRFAEDLLRFLLANKQLVRKQTGWGLVEGSAGKLPSGLQALYQARLGDVAAGSRQLAETLAVHGGPLALEVAARAAALSLDAAEEAAADLVARQLAVVGPHGLGLADQQLASWLAGELAPEDRTTRHGALAGALAVEAGEYPSLRVLNALAHHGLMGPEPASARRWLFEAARQNLALRALAEARRFGRAAADHADGLAPAERLEVLEVLASAHRGLDEADAALAIAAEAVSLAEDLGDPALLARSLNGLGKIHQLASRYDQARTAFERASEVAGEDVPLELCRSHRAIARLCFFAGDMEGAYRHGRQALILARRHAQPAERAQVLAEVGETFQGEEDRLQEGLACLEEAQAIARDLADRHLESMASAGLGNLQLALGQLAGAKASFSRAAELFEAIGNTGEGLFARLNLALVAEEQGHFAEAEELAAAVAADAKRLNRKFPMAAAMAVEGSAQAHLGRTTEGLNRLAEATEIAEEIKHKILRAVIRQLEAPLRCLLGQFDEARAEAQALAEFGEAAGAQEFVQRAALVKAEVALETGAIEEALAELEPMLHVSNAAVRLHAQIMRAEAARRLGHEATAYQALHAARALTDEVDAPRAEGPLMILEAELEGGDVAGTLAEAAVKVLENTQQRHTLVLALDALARLGPTKGRKAASGRARELVNSLASALGANTGRYLAAFGRAIIAAEPAAPTATAIDLTGPVPTTLNGLKELAARLAQGLGQLDAQGLSAIGGGMDGDLAAHRLEQIVSFARAVNSTLKLDTVIDRALALVIDITGAERGLLLLKEGPNMTSQRYATAPGFEDEGGGGSEQYSRTIARTVLETGETVCVLDALSDPRFAQQASIMGLNLQTIIAVPLKDQDEVIGAIYVDRQGLSDTFSQGDLEIVLALAGLTATAIVNAKLMKSQEERQVHLEMLNQLSRTLSRTLELEKVLDVIADIALEVAKAERTFILLWEDEQLVFGAGRDHDGPLPPQAAREISRTICQKVVDTQQPISVIDAGRDEEFSTKMSVVNLKLASVVAVPLIGQSGLTGVLYVDSRSKVGPALEKEVAVLHAIANTAALAVDNARLYRQATVDHLTGLYVRSFFLMRLEEEIRRTRRFGGKFSLLVMDIDHFKKFNDNYGHQTGDAVLRVVAKTIRDAIRVGLDLPCRYGGEEMLVLLPETDTTGALITAERIRKLIETTGVPGPDGEALRVTISIGLATFPQMADSSTELFERADQALYASKHNGRNRCTVYELEVPSS